MNIICPKCGNQLDESITVCPVCGTNIKNQEQQYNSLGYGNSQQPNDNAHPQMNQTDNPPSQPQQPQQDYYNDSVQPQQGYYNTPAQPQQGYYNDSLQPQQGYCAPQPPLTDNKPSKRKAKKHKLPLIIRIIIVIIIVVGILLGAWYAFGNLITLGAHSNQVVETLNSGSLDLPGMNNAYNELPNYVKDMLGEEHRNSGEYGPMTKTILPHISVEKVKVNGFFGSSSVEYKITAPDIESWLLNLDSSLITSTDALMSMMEEYITTAPTRSANVTIEYTRDGFFSTEWFGNYYTREFSDAVCGGFNSAYNELYSKVYNEIMGTLSEAQEEKQ